MIRAYCISDNNNDIYKNTNTAFPGGSGLNAAVNFVRTGNQAAYCGYVGNDKLGQLQIDGLKAEGVDTSYMHIENEQNDWCFIKLIDGDRRFGAGSNQMRDRHHLTKADVEAGQTGEFDLIYTCRETTFDDDAWEQLGKSNVPVVCDYSNYWDFWGEGVEKDLLKESKGIVDYFYMSMEGRPEDPEELLKRCVSEYGAKGAIATMGSKGSLFYNGRRFYHQDAYLVEAVDTMGAGDTFLASFTSSYFDGLKLLKSCASQIGWDENNEHYQACDDRLIEKSLAFAAMCSAKNCMMDGGFGHGIPFEDDMVKRTDNLKEVLETPYT